jgi:ribonuclease BN (tRNA processing enzyme)
VGETTGVKLTVVGCSPAWPNPGSAQSGYLIETTGRLLLDCGPGVLARLRERAEGNWPQVDAIVITHFHLDHWGDLVPWAWGAMYGPGRSDHRAELWLPPGGTETLRAFGARFGFEDMFDNVFAVREYEEGRPFTAAGSEVTALRVPHYELLTFGLRVSNGNRTLAYSGDSAPSDHLVELARDVDLFLCEATLAHEEPDLRGHLTADEAVSAFRDSGATRLIVIHRPHELPLDEELERAHDGLELTL